VDDHLHQAFGIPSCHGGELHVAAACGGLDFEADDLVAEVGYPLRFSAKGVAERAYPLRLTLHRGDHTLTRLVRTVEIVPPSS
jgi:hypothetical protein